MRTLDGTRKEITDLKTNNNSQQEKRKPVRILIERLVMPGIVTGTYEYIKKYGLKALWCSTFHIDSKHHDMYQHGFSKGLTMDKKQLEKLILHLSISIPRYDPARTNGICQIRGFADAGLSRFGESFGRVA